MEEGGKLERAFGVIKTLNLTNVLILALIVVIAIPAYFAYKFMSDLSFRREFMSSAIILSAHAPCIVLEGTRQGSNPRHSVFIVYGLDGRNEKLIGLRAPDAQTPEELTALCQRVVVLSDQINEFRRKESEDKANVPPR
jgi:hypothetical protein